MKTAVCIPDSLFNVAERTSKRLGITHSRPYAKAVETFLSSHRATGVQEALDAVYGTEASKLNPALAAMPMASF